MSTRLSAEQVATFNEAGYLVIPAVFRDDEVREFREEADFILELIVNSSICNERHSNRLDLREVNGHHVVRKIQPINDLSLVLSKASNDPRLLDPLRTLMADEPVLMEEKLNYKQDLGAKFDHLVARPQDDHFPIHHDWAYYRAQNYPQNILSSAITMDDMTADSGPIQVWPGTHRSSLAHRVRPLDGDDTGYRDLEVVPGLVDREAGVDLIVPGGSVLLFHSLLVHASRANESGKPRRLMIYSHYPKAANMGFDMRNGPNRLRESPHEWRYLRARDAGRYADQFRVNRIRG
ncbi:MAG: phytanoyl-CoA dioxygenase family protein [Gammaproteobacteria bacterium]|nr:phytanoyl-CoA dioxygenase family protein [Gammaproteobacteria bacterium]